MTLRSRYKSAGKVQRIKKARNNKTFDTKIKLTYTLTYATSIIRQQQQQRVPQQGKLFVVASLGLSKNHSGMSKTCQRKKEEGKATKNRNKTKHKPITLVSSLIVVVVVAVAAAD